MAWLWGFLGLLLYLGAVAHRLETAPPATRVERVLASLAAWPLLLFAAIVFRYGELGGIVRGVPTAEWLVGAAPWLWLFAVPFFLAYMALTERRRA